MFILVWVDYNQNIRWALELEHLFICTSIFNNLAACNCLKSVCIAFTTYCQWTPKKYISSTIKIFFTIKIMFRM